MNDTKTKPKAERNTNSYSKSENIPNKVGIQKAKIFHNKTGLKEEIEIEGHCIELIAISRIKEQSVEELIEHVSVWIPKCSASILWFIPGVFSFWNQISMMQKRSK